MNNIIIRNVEPQNITIGGGGSVIGLTTVYVNGVDVTVGSSAYVIVPTKLSELENDEGFITTETDPTVPYFIKQLTISDINRWNNKQDALVSSVNIKTINNNSILGSGNLEIEGNVYTAGTGIEITNENVVNNTITSYNDLSDLPTIPSKTSDLNNDSDFVSSDDLSEVAFTGSYNSLSDTPVIPDSTSELTNDGEDGEHPFITNQTDNLVNYYDKEFLFNILPKVSGTGTSITLNNTIEAKMKSKLSPSEMEQEGTPTPDSLQDIHTTTGDNVIRDEGKNLLPRATISETKNGVTFTANEDGSVKVSGTATANTYYNLTKQTLQAGTYTLSGGVNSNCKIISNYGGSYQISQSAGVTFTLSEETTPTEFYIQITNTTAITTPIIFYPMIRLASVSDDTYEPYSLDTYPLTLGTLEYSKIGNYEDEFIYNTTDTNLELNKWYLKKNIGKVVLDGSETWGGYAFGNYYRYSTSINNIKMETSTNIQFISNYFYGNASALDSSNCLPGMMANTSNTTNVYFISNETSISNFQLWLSTHNTDVYYLLATPQYTLCNDTLQTQLTNIYNNMMSKKGQTNISQVNDGLPMVITASALKDSSNL